MSLSASVPPWTWYTLEILCTTGWIQSQRIYTLLLLSHRSTLIYSGNVPQRVQYMGCQKYQVCFVVVVFYLFGVFCCWLGLWVFLCMCGWFCLSLILVLYTVKCLDAVIYYNSGDALTSFILW